MALLLVAGTPVIGIAGANALLAYERDISTSRQVVELLREAALGRHTAALESLRGMVTGLAAGNIAASAPAGDCDQRLRDLQSSFVDRYTNIWTLDSSLHVLCSAMEASRDTSYEGFDYVIAVRHQREFALGGFKVGALSRQPVIIGAMPIIENGAITQIVAAGLRLDVFLRNAPQGTQPHDIWLLDGTEGVLSVSGATSSRLPETAPLARMLAAGTATEILPDRDGEPYAYATVALDPDLRLLVGLPTAPRVAAARAALMQRVGELAIFLFASLAAIILGAELAVSRPLRGLARCVRDWRPGASFRPAQSWSTPSEVEAVSLAFGKVVESLARRSSELQGALEQYDLVIAEMHHRVKNNIQVIASLLTLQAARAGHPAAEAALAMARDRVRALATLHRHLYARPQIEAVDINAFLTELGPQLFAAVGETRGGRIGLELDIDSIEIMADQAVSLALLVTEAVINALRHGFPEGRPGSIKVSIHHDDAGLVTLHVADDGIGPAGDAMPGIGLTLIEGFAAALGGRPEWGGPPGTQLTVRFPLRVATEAALKR